MLVFNCPTCRTALSAEDPQAGQLVRCPTCSTTLRVPGAVPEGVVATAGAIGSDLAGSAIAGGAMAGGRSTGTFLPPGAPRVGGKRYGFNCVYCSSRLEATEAMAAQEGQCPTCGNNIVIPILDRYGRLIDPITRQIIKQDPHPVHAYAAAGDRAPTILRNPDGTRVIRCSRCSSVSPVTANNCRSCGMPFTMEGTTIEAAGASNGFCVASLVLGIVGLPAACIAIPSLLAVIFGIIGWIQVNKMGEGAKGGRGMAIAGIICGAVGLGLFLIAI